MRRFLTTLFIFCTPVLVFCCTKANAAHVYPEKYYQKEWCSRWDGNLEYLLPDRTRVDCITKSYAVEFDFAPKWAEAVGQSLYYSKMTGKQAAIILILEKETDFKYFERAKTLAQDNNIQLWYMKSPEFGGHAPANSINGQTMALNTKEFEKMLKTVYRLIYHLL